ncbi:beta-1,6-N-acetylglucosaminyltransferase [Roseibacterium sp. SDUM158016]|uniref:beta-1,6-N-acetylglucosaminyltransferase n=1 Tax=Roseicyclus sediminis TaxID=2980997 RepID=UPI0021D10D17|nr:beta-1,6-N-acetylglucosaminyltransferase [Roseibacterium sp. SDUM158016]MCU4653311.1 beta-1,6-N-acetylglucosaminyltransferase [Roseibacterium sp. SDUM158016]
MAKIAFILLCHKDPDAIIRQAERLTASGDCVAIHFDARAPVEAYQKIREALADRADVTFAARRAKCGWGEWSLVRATLNAVEAAVEAFPDATHFYMLSGDCAPVKSAAYAHAFLDAADRDYIESFDFFASDWIKTGLKRERLVYRHVVNERTQKRLFYGMMALQRRLGLERRIPADIQVMIGSQWWCLRRRTIEAILDFIRQRPDVVRFFRTTWIPDETFFQTLVRHLVPDREIASRSLTFKMFSDYGMPVTFYNDQYDLLISQDDLFARKISPEAVALKDRLAALWDSGRTDFTVGQEGPKLHAFLTGRGRIGRRFGTRFWERESTLGPDRELFMIVCKKWHVAKRMLHAAEDRLAIRGIEYLFDEDACPVPHLGGIERTLEKRNRHRRALMRMLFDYYGTDRLMICLDPANIDLMRDFMSDRANARILELQCVFDDQYLVGHARRVGLATEKTPDEVIQRMLPTLRHEFDDQSVRIREAEFQNHWRLREGRSTAENAAVLSSCFDMDPDTGYALAETPYLFSD